MLLKSGSDLDSALGVMLDSRLSSKAKGLREGTDGFSHALASIRAKVRQGEPLSESLASYPKYFESYFVSMVKSGEASGELLSAFTELQKQLERDQDLNERVGSALVYPTVLVVVTMLSLLVLMVFILPQLSGLFTAFSGELSSSARFLMSAGRFFDSWGQTILVSLVFSILLLFVFEKSLHTRARIKALLSRIPVIRQLSQQLEFSRFSSSLASLLNAGLTQIDATVIAAEVFSAPGQRTKVQRAVEMLREGQSFSTAIRAFPELATYYSHSIESGEKSGQLGDALQVLAERLQRDYALRTQRLITVLEPCLIVLMGVVVGFVIFTVFSTIQSMGNFAV